MIGQVNGPRAGTSGVGDDSDVGGGEPREVCDTSVQVTSRSLIESGDHSWSCSSHKGESEILAWRTSLPVIPEGLSQDIVSHG